MHVLTSHKVNSTNAQLEIEATDDPGSGGAYHVYAIRTPVGQATIAFQNGPIAEVGVNGITHEALLAIIEDRLRAFQGGPFACRENAIALTKIQEALMWLHKRTQDRMTRGVEGTSTV